uniref:MICAL-like 1a n=1 Tax=Tetraodon nigroviridis TaxID=99883 RepID=H3CL74_TETNG
MMGSLRGLQEWCRTQCEDYNDVSIKDMSASFRDGLAFCAIIHRFRPELIDFASLSKENVYQNNQLAFDVAETQLGIPALLDPEDMVSMKVPDRLSVITYVSQYYNYFNNKSHAVILSAANPPNPASVWSTPSSINRHLFSNPPSSPTQNPQCGHVNQPSQPAEAGGEAAPSAKRSVLSSTCAACHEHVHLVQRFLADGKLYHRNCFRCSECHSTLLPGSYKLESSSGVLVCTHHVTKQMGPTAVQSARIGRSTVVHASLSEREAEMVSPGGDSVTVPAVGPNDEAPAGKSAEASGEKEEAPRPSTPPNPFDERATRPVPAPRRVSEPTPPPRPAPRVRLLRAQNGQWFLRGGSSESQKPPTPPKPRERSQSPGSLSSGTHKPKDPPWLALVQSEHRKKKQATPPDSGSLSSLKGEESGPSTPPSPANPFDEDDEEGEENRTAEGGGGEGAALPATLVAGHPWYSITQAADAPGADDPPAAGSWSRSASPGGTRSKKRYPPRLGSDVLPLCGPVLPHSEPSSCSPSPALSTDSLSSSSDRSSSQLLASSGDPLPVFTKSVSEPSICSPCDPASSPGASQSLRPAPTPPNATSAPATPQTGRSCGTGAAPGGAGPPAPGGTPTHSKRTCKENPFNRRASPSPSKSNNRPPKGPRPARPPAPGHGFPLIKRKVQSDQYIPAEDIYGEMTQLEQLLDSLEQTGVELEKKLRDNPNDEDEERLLVDWFTLIHEKHLLVRREAELVYTAKQQNLEERQADVEYELRCLLNKPEKDWTEEDKGREQELMAELVTIIEQRNQIVNSMDQDRQREEEEDKLIGAMLKKKDFHKDPPGEHQQKKKGAKFKPIKVLKRLSHKGDAGRSPEKDQR